MTLAPIIARELASALRSKDVLKTRMRYALVGSGLALFFLLLGARQLYGQSLHTLLLSVGLWIAVVQTPALTADLFSSERRNQTLPLLMLAGLRPGQLFVYKVLGGGMIAFSNLLAMVPFLAIPFLSGGLSLSLFLSTVGCLPNLLLLALSVTIFASVCCGEEGETLAVATAIGGLLIGVTPALYLASHYVTNASLVPPGWLLLSPAYGPFMIFRKFTVGSPVDFWRNSAVTLGWSCLLLIVAVWILDHTWQNAECPKTGAASRLQFRAWLHGTSHWRRNLGRRWLDKNPFAWLALHDRMTERLGWGLIGGMTLGTLIGLYFWPPGWSSMVRFFLGAILLNATLETWVFYTAGKCLGDERRNGTLELLLTTPLEVPHIIEGQLKALQTRFQPIFWTLLGLNSVLMISGLCLRPWNRESVCVYLLLWLPLLVWSFKRRFRFARLGMWASLNCGRPAYAAWKCSGLNSFVWLWMLFNVRGFGTASRTFPSGSQGEFTFVMVAYCSLLAIVLSGRSSGNSAEKRLLADFRSIAQEPVPSPSDPRFKKWKVQDRFPSEKSLIFLTLPQDPETARRERIKL